MIGSFGSVLVSLQVSVKIPGFRPPDGKPVVSTGALEDEPDDADPADPADPEDPADPADSGDEDEDCDADADADADARLTATTDETAAADAAARTTTPEAAIMRRDRVNAMGPVNVRCEGTRRVFTLPKQRPSTTPTFQ